MTEKRLPAAWLRPLAGIFALVGVLGLTACGGGSGAPNNPYAPGPATPGPLAVLPATLTVYAGTPATLTISGGVPPYNAFSSDTAVLPISLGASSNTIVLIPASVGTATNVTITVQDASGSTVSAAVTVQPAPLLNGLTITPNSAACGTNAVCSGQTATASVTVTGPAGGGIPNRQVRFDVVSGDYDIQTSSPAAPLVSTLTVTSDANGLAQVLIKARANAFTQPALLRATEMTTGNQVTGQFTIVQTTNGSAVLSVIPNDATITSASSTSCTSGFRVDYYIYGGTPPYRVTNTFPDGATLVNSTVATSGGFFEAITNGTCVDPLVFSIFDAVGMQTTANLHNVLGTASTNPIATPIVVAPTTVTIAGAGSCTGKTFPFVLTGGTAPFSVVSGGAIVTPNPVPTSPGSFNVSGLTDASGLHTIFIGDASKPQLTTTATITCNP